MKWSFLTVLATVCAVNAVTAWAVDPKTGNSPKPAAPEQFNPAALPGQEFFNTFGSQNDPFYTPNLFNPNPVVPPTQVAPGTHSGTTIPVPNPMPDTYPQPLVGRSRINNPYAPQYVPPGHPTPTPERRWRIGVYSKDLETGVKIMDVVPNRAAHRAGLEPGDLIVSVNGYQAGFVNGQLYDLATEFERNADQDGWVTLLVQDNRTRSLLNVPVQLDSRMSRIEGSVAFQGRPNLSNAILNIELREIIRPNAAPVTFATKQMSNLSGTTVPFEVEYDPAHVSNRGNYVVHANVISSGRELYRTEKPFQVLQDGTSRPMTIVLQRVRPQYDNGAPPINPESQIAQIVKWFEEYLGRTPTDRELAAWMKYIQQGNPLQELQADLLGHVQFWNRCNRDKITYIQKVHESIVGRSPESGELEYWVERYDAQNGVRSDLARELQQALR